MTSSDSEGDLSSIDGLAISEGTKNKETQDAPQQHDMSKFDDLVDRPTCHGTTIQADFVETIQHFISSGNNADVSSRIQSSTSSHGAKTPTKIQSACWSTMLSPQTNERDVIAISKTGSGKTLAFLVPLLASMTAKKSQTSKNEGKFIYPRAVILAPTRVIAQQIYEVASFLVKQTASMVHNDVTVSVALGGSAYHQQMADLLSSDPDVIIATPGRLNSLCGRVKDGTPTTTTSEMCVKLEEVCEMIIDEADMMLALGFQNDISWFAQLLNEESAYGFRLVLTSATWDTQTSASLSLFETNSEEEPVLLTTGASCDGGKVTNNVTQKVEVLAHKGAPRFKHLCALLMAALRVDSESRVIVFCLHKSQTRQMGKDLHSKDISNVVLEGDMSQSARSASLETFRKGTLGRRVLVATDVAARGLDVLGVSHVFNYSLGISIESYIHRCGRTGRAGKFGVAHTFVVKGDEKFAPELVTVLQQTNQFVVDDLRIMARKELKRRKRGSATPKNEDEMELQEIRQANKEKQLRNNQQNQRGSKQNSSKRRGGGRK